MRLKKDKMLQLIRYGFWGCATVFVGLLSYALLEIVFDYRVANIISIIFTKVFAYFSNKRFVFRTKTTLYEQLGEIMRFIFARGISGIVDFLGQIFLVEVLGSGDFFAKCIMIIITTVINYFLSAYGVFRDQR